MLLLLPRWGISFIINHHDHAKMLLSFFIFLRKKEIAKVLDGKLTKHSTLITDKHPSYSAYAKDNPTIKHKQLLAKDHVDKNDKTLHLQK